MAADSVPFHPLTLFQLSTVVDTYALTVPRLSHCTLDLVGHHYYYDCSDPSQQGQGLH